MSKAKGTSPRKFAEKIALLNKKEAEATAEFEKIIKEVEQTTQQRPTILPPNFLGTYQNQQEQYWPLPTRSSSFSSWQTSSSSPSQNDQNQYYDQPTSASQYQQHLQSVRQQYIQHNQHQQQSFYSDQYESLGNQQQQPGDSYMETASPAQSHHNQQQVHSQQYHPSQTLSTSNGGHVIGNPQSPMRVPNIEIFPIEDDYNTYQQQQVTTAVSNIPATVHHQHQQHPSGNAGNNLVDNYIRNDCSNSSISSARSLPNIANLCVASSPTYQTGPSPALSQHRLTPPAANEFNVTTTTTTRTPPSITSTPAMSPATATTTATVIINNNTIDHYNNDSNSAYSSDQQDYCSLPIQVTYQTTINRRPSEHQICSITSNNNNQTMTTTTTTANVLDPAWPHQTQINKSSVPNSPAHTPPILINNQQLQHQMIDTTTNHQISLHPVSNNIHQHPNDFNMSTQHHSLHPHHDQQQNLSFGSPIMRANSTNIINSYENSSDQLLSRPINNVLSKSTDACYGYLPS